MKDKITNYLFPKHTVHEVFLAIILLLLTYLIPFVEDTNALIIGLIILLSVWFVDVLIGYLIYTSFRIIFLNKIQDRSPQRLKHLQYAGIATTTFIGAFFIFHYLFNVYLGASKIDIITGIFLIIAGISVIRYVIQNTQRKLS